MRRVILRHLTHLGSAWATIGAAVAIAGVDPRLGLATLIALALSHAIVQVLKRAVARPRPCDASGRPLALVALPDPFSFPSGHAAAAFAVAGSVSLHAPAFGAVLLPLAGLVAASRVALRVHHPGDVVAGSVLGVAGAVAAALLQ
jgi:undecaprenyl-diphosphatase